MGTRSVVEIHESESGKRGRRLVALYRHWDGYPAIGGACLARALILGRHETDVARSLLVWDKDAEDGGSYELTPGAETHGDLEHVYRVWGIHPGAWIVEHLERGDAGPESWSSHRYDLAGFISMVNGEREAMNERAKAMNLQDYEPAQSIELPAAEVLP